MLEISFVWDGKDSGWYPEIFPVIFNKEDVPVLLPEIDRWSYGLDMPKEHIVLKPKSPDYALERVNVETFYPKGFVKEK